MNSINNSLKISAVGTGLPNLNNKNGLEQIDEWMDLAKAKTAVLEPVQNLRLQELSFALKSAIEDNGLNQYANVPTILQVHMRENRYCEYLVQTDPYITSCSSGKTIRLPAPTPKPIV